jgi:hypothetical protein
MGQRVVAAMQPDLELQVIRVIRTRAKAAWCG